MTVFAVHVQKPCHGFKVKFLERNKKTEIKKSSYIVKVVRYEFAYRYMTVHTVHVCTTLIAMQKFRGSNSYMS